jgi:hypothetical protein
MNKELMKLLLPSKSIGGSNLKPEQAMCVEFANTMRKLTLEKNLSYIWFHIPNEFLPSTRVNYSFELKQKHMGKMSGVPDYCFIGEKDSFFIEFKAGKGKQSPNQKVFEGWCTAQDVPYYLCRSANEGAAIVLQRESSFMKKEGLTPLSIQ